MGAASQQEEVACQHLGPGSPPMPSLLTAWPSYLLGHQRPRCKLPKRGSNQSRGPEYCNRSRAVPSSIIPGVPASHSGS